MAIPEPIEPMYGMLRECYDHYGREDFLDQVVLILQEEGWSEAAGEVEAIRERLDGRHYLDGPGPYHRLPVTDRLPRTSPSTPDGRRG